MIEHRHVPVQRLFVELLLVQRPAELVQGQLVVRRGAAHGDDRAVGALRIEVFLAHEVVFAAPEVHLVDVLRIGILGDQAVHDLHGLVGLADLVVGARHLVEHLVVALVIRVGLEDLPVRFDGLAGTGRDHFAARTCEDVVVSRRLAQQFLTLRRALLEFLLGLGRPGGSRCSCARFGPLERRSARGRRHVCGFGFRHRLSPRRLRDRRFLRRQLDDLARADHAVSLLDLQVGEAAHGFGCPRSLGRLFEVAPVTLRCTLEPVLEVNLLDVGLHAREFGKRALLGDGGAAGEQAGRGDEEKTDAPDHSTSLLACAWVARS